MGGVISLASCSSDEPLPNGEPGEVNFTVQLPADQATRSGEGSAVNQLTYAIYDQNEDGTPGSKRITKTIAMAGGTATIREKLVPGKTYTAAFWAANTEAPYTFDTDAMTVTVNTTPAAEGANPTIAGSSENCDGFFGSLKDINATASAESNTVTLTRPFAQLNLGTDDLEDVKNQGIDVTALSCDMTVNGVYTAMNIFTGEVTGETQALTYATATLPGDTYPQSGYKYLCYAYVLLPVDQETLTVGYATGNTRLASGTWNNVPAKRNMRTNIYGSLLTNPTDITVNVNATWTIPDFTYEPTVVAKTVEDLYTQLQTPGKSVTVPKEATIVLPKDQTLNIAQGTQLIVEGSLTTSSPNQIQIKGDPSSTNPTTIEGNGTVTAPDGTGFTFYMSDNANVVVKDVTIACTDDETDGSSGAAFAEEATVTMENVKITSPCFGLVARGNTTVTINNSDITIQNANPSVPMYGSAIFSFWSSPRCSITLNNTDITVHNGWGVTAASGVFNIYGGSVSVENTAVSDEPGYALFATNDAKINVHDGSFRTSSMMNAVIDGVETTMNAVAYYESTNYGGGIYLYGGKFSGQGYDGNTKAVLVPQTGYKWQANQGADAATYPWIIVKN